MTEASDGPKLTGELKKSWSLIKATLESTVEAIFVANKNKKIIEYNKQFMELWGINGKFVKDAKDAHTLFRKLSLQVKTPTHFLKMIDEIIKNPETEMKVELTLTSGKTVEFNSHPQRLLFTPKVIGTVLSFRDISQQKQLELQLSQYSLYDSLTGLPNRTLLTQKAEEAMTYAEQNNKYVAVLLIGIDNFKEINESLGHEAGDMFLTQVAKRISQIVSDVQNQIVSDMGAVGRLGGDEFAVVLVSEPNEDHIVAVTRKLLKKIAETYLINEHELSLTACIGISIYPVHSQDVSYLFKNANAALFAAKKQGHNSFQIYEAAFNKNILSRLKLENDLHVAFKQKSLLVYFHPIMHIQTDNLSGIETVLRWRHPKLGFISTENFNNLAETTGLIVPIYNKLILKSCMQIKTWTEAGLYPLRVNVGIVLQQFVQPDFIDSVDEILQTLQYNSNLLELELSEEILLTVPENDLTKKLNQLKNMGVHFAFENFGKAINLKYIKNFSSAKIIVQMKNLEEDPHFLDDIVSNAKKGIRILVKGVETYRQLELLRNSFKNETYEYILNKTLDKTEFFQLLKDNLKDEKIKIDWK